jgi:hypothetical protein
LLEKLGASGKILKNLMKSALPVNQEKWCSRPIYRLV